jgi:ATP phosphoribosyltransferase
MAGEGGAQVAQAGGGDDEPLRLALPKGRILDEATALFGRAGIDLSPVKANARKLVHDLPRAAGLAPLRVFVIRDSDVPTFVEYGAADVGIAGRDVLEEQGRDLYQPLDLRIGACRLAVAEPEERPVDDRSRLHLRIATKFPNLTRQWLEQRGMVAEVIKLYGSVELGPLTGLADRIVDLVSTGETLRQNRLREVETLLEVTARLVVNRASLKLRVRAVDALVARLRGAVEGRA